MTTPNSADDRAQSACYGEFTAPNLVFNVSLQEFSQRVGLICSLETNGQLRSEEAYRQIKNLWKALKASKRDRFDPGH